ncbi:hypothetical protein [Salinihabitans flavidus]|uniref:hypothetical protein n=1 Tax=Salinihabitans flavidus TaxID=569882 RepID=UPI0015876D42|nr:hypothetical protein [Salinihabitans flavidus]
MGAPDQDAGERSVLARQSTYLTFVAPIETGFAAPVLAVAKVLDFSCFGFLISLFPRLLLPFPITTSHVE